MVWVNLERTIYFDIKNTCREGHCFNYRKNNTLYEVLFFKSKFSFFHYWLFLLPVQIVHQLKHLKSGWVYPESQILCWKFRYRQSFENCDNSSYPCVYRASILYVPVPPGSLKYVIVPYNHILSSEIIINISFLSNLCIKKGLIHIYILAYLVLTLYN